MIEAHDGQPPPGGRPGESWPGSALAGIGAIQEACRQEIPERPVISAGVEVPGHHLWLIDCRQRLPDQR